MGEESQNVPSNHRLAERELIAMVRDGQWEIDGEGRIWRISMRCGLKAGGSHVVSVPRRRAEKVLPSGYLMVRAVLGGRRVVGMAHRLVWQHLRGDIPAGLTVNHKDGIRGRNHPDNLELATYSEQVTHSRRVLGHGDQSGEKNHAAKLTDEQVRSIRMRRAAGERLRTIAADFDVSFQTISEIARGDRRAGAAGPTSTEDGRRTCTQPRGEEGHFISRDDGGRP